MLRQIEEATLGGKGASIVVAFDRSTAMIGSSTLKGFNRLMMLEGAVQKKGIDTKTKETFYEELVAQITAIDARIHSTVIILASSNFWKDSLFKQIDVQARELRKKTKWIECDEVSEGAVVQLSMTKEFQQLTMGRSQSDILNSFEEILRRIGTDGTATYGLQEVERAAQQSAVGVVLISQRAMHDAREKGNFERLESLLSQI
jgi:stalled ribosome rescue protein Dom34